MSPCESFVVSLRELPVGRSGMECRDLDVSVGEQLVSSHRTQDDARGVLDMRRKLEGPLRGSSPV